VTLLIVLASVAAYLGIGAAYARTQAVACWQRARKRWSYDDIARQFVIPELVWRALAWPYAVVFDLLRDRVAGWIWAPVNDRRAQAEQHRADADAWRGKQWTGTPAEREMAAELARMCDERAREVDL
jgi:hypothetical protein